MQAQTTRTFGRNPIIGTAIGIGILAASVLGIAQLSDSVELPSLGNSATQIERRVEAPAAGKSYSFREANLYHPGFESRQVVRSAVDTAFLEANLIVPGFDRSAVARPAVETAFIEANTVLPEASVRPDTRPALETAFLEMNQVLPEYRERVEIRTAEETIFVEWNTILHPGWREPAELTPNQPS